MKRWELGRKKGKGSGREKGEKCKAVKRGKGEKRGKGSQNMFFDSPSTNIIKPESSLGNVKKMNLKGVMMWCFSLGSECNNYQESFMGDDSFFL